MKPEPIRRVLLCGCVALALLARHSVASSADLYVISNMPMNLSAEEIKEVFLGESQFSGKQRLVPVTNTSAHAEFTERILRMNVARYSVWWTKKSFRDGVNPPPAVSGDTQVVNFVRGTPGAIGYVTAPAQGVHVVGKL